MRDKILLFSSIVLMMVVVACSRNVVTGRKQLALVPDSQLRDMARVEYQSFLSQNKVVSASASKDAEMVKRVGTRISKAITQYYTDKGQGEVVEGYQWEYNLVDDKAANAWAMPGGKIVIYTGILPITQNEAGLAVVMGHEVAHATARHGNERMSQGLLQQLGGVALSVALANKPAQTHDLFMTAYGVGSNVGIMLPHSRKQELEADRLGLMYTAMAGYNPREAIPLWERMRDMSNSPRPPEFLSTHPAEDTRIDQLKKEMPKALKYYKPVSGSN